MPKQRTARKPAASEPAVEYGTARLADLKPAAYNPRKIDKAAKRALRRSVETFGVVQPLVVNRRNHVVVGGHQRLEQLLEMGRTEAPVVWVDLDETREKALNVTLNSPHVAGEFDHGMLGDILRDLQAVPDFEFAELRLDDLLKTTPPMLGIGDDSDDGSGDDDAPEVRPVVVSRPGEVYALGPHRLLCGDCRNPGDLLTLFDGERVNVAVTSPPYASQREYDPSSGFKPIPPDRFVDWFEAVQAGVRSVLADDGSWFVNIKPHCEDGQRSLYVLDLVAAHVRRWGWRFVDEFVWVHGGTPGEAHRRFKNGFEPTFQFAPSPDFKFRPGEVRHESDAVRGRYSERRRERIGAAESQGRTGDIFANPELGEGLAYPSNVLRLGKNRESLGHGAAFPVDLPAFFVRAYSDIGDVVFDPFMGSGTTMIAAATYKRRAFGTEISPGYCDVIRRRWTKWARENQQDPGAGALE